MARACCLRSCTSGAVADGEHVDGGLLDPVEPEHLVDLVIHEGTHAARSKAERLGREVAVLAQMAGFDEAVAVAAILVLGAHPLKDLGQEDDRTALTQELLLDRLIDDALAHIAGSDQLELM